MMKRLLFLLVLTTLSTSAAADIDWKTVDCPTLALQQKTFELVELVRSKDALSFMNGETVNLTVFREGLPFKLSGVVTEGHVTQFQCELRTDASVGVTIQQAAIEQLYRSTDFPADLIRLKENGGIRVEAYSPIAHVKVAIGELALFVSRALGIKALI